MEMPGLAHFIADIRKCKCQEDEIKKVNKELANIRAKFKSDKNISGYTKKKYLCKLIFMFLLGHDSDIGTLEAINLLTSNHYSEKSIGYLFVSVVMSEKSNLKLMVQSAIKNDLSSTNHIHQNLALQYAANMANATLANDILEDVLRILFNSGTKEKVKQSAILCLLHIIRVNPEIAVSDEYIKQIVGFISSLNLGIVTAASSLLEELAEKGKLDGYPIVSTIVSIIHRFFRDDSNDFPDYTYYKFLSPWLVVKLLRLLRKFIISPDSVVRVRVLDCIGLILDKCEESPISEKLKYKQKNSKNAIVFEIVLLIQHIEAEVPVILRVCSILDAELAYKDINSRYLVMDMMCLMSEYEVARRHFIRRLKLLPRKHLFCSESDNSIKQKVSDLLYHLCDKKNIEDVINELNCYVLMCDNASLKEETILKIAYLAEKFYGSTRCYVETVLALLQNFGPYVRHEIWFRFVEMVKKTKDLHGYASVRVFDFIKNCSRTEISVNIAGYILGEYGNLIAGDPNANSREQFQWLQKHFLTSSLETKALLLTTYMKFINLFPGLKNDICKIFQEYAKHSDTEIQQRASEYLKLSENSSLGFILEVMPLRENSESVVLGALKKIKPDLDQSRVCKERNMHLYRTQINVKQNMKSLPALQRTTSSMDVMIVNNVDKKRQLKRWSTVQTKVDDLIEKKPQSQALGMNDNTLRKVGERSVSENTKGSELVEKKSYVEILANIFETTPVPIRVSVPSLSDNNTASFDPLIPFIWQDSGVIFENNILVVTCHCEFNKNFGRIFLTYKNKSMNPFQYFLPTFIFQTAANLKLDMKPCVSTLSAGESVKQEINMECMEVFFEKPMLSVSFQCFNDYSEVKLKLPITLNKFFEPATFNTDMFRKVWNNFIGVEQELVKVFQGKLPMDSDMLVRKLKGMKVSVLPNLNQNLPDIYGAAVFHSSLYQVGVLYRLQSNKSTKLYRLTVRGGRKTVLTEIVKLMENLV